jgi:catechol 2,3-dioxygenase-like lactoylglutathione lyase family enzyme
MSRSNPAAGSSWHEEIPMSDSDRHQQPSSASDHHEAGAPKPLAGILETSLYATDLTAMRHFYAEVLGLAVIVAVPGRHVFFRCGEGVLLIFNPDATATPDSDGPDTVPPHGARGPGHVAFAVHEDELPVWRHRLQARGVTIEAEIVWPRGGHSLYFRDPAGNSLELASPRLWNVAATGKSEP